MTHSKMRLIVASNNSNKLRKFREILGERFDIVSMHEAGIDADIEENGTTFEENALIKANYVMNACHCAAAWGTPSTVALSVKAGTDSTRRLQGPRGHRPRSMPQRARRSLGRHRPRGTRACSSTLPSRCSGATTPPSRSTPSA